MNDKIFDLHSTNGIITKELLIELSNTTDCFYSYDFSIDKYGRKTGDRIAKINQILKAKGIVTQFANSITPGMSLYTVSMCKNTEIVSFLHIYIFFQLFLWGLYRYRILQLGYCFLEFGFTSATLKFYVLIFVFN